MFMEANALFIQERNKETTGLFQDNKGNRIPRQNSVPTAAILSLIPKFHTICPGQKRNVMHKGLTCSTVALSDLSLTRYLAEVKIKLYNPIHGLITLTE